jgi:hypothetical protein
LHQQLTDLGFTRSRRGEGYRHNGVTFSPEGAWSTLRSTEPLVGVDPLRGLLGEPGAWHFVRGADCTIRKLLELPSPVFNFQTDADALDDAESPLRELLNWGLATDKGLITSGWKAPERAEIDTWMSPGALTIQRGPIVRQGRIHLEANRLAIRFPLVTSLPEGLSANRRLWLRELLLDGQNRWRMVRLGLTEQGAEAEIDLSGAPPVVLEPLFKASLDALRWVVQWLALSAAFLADPAVACQAWEVCPLRAGPAERKVIP